MKPLECLTKQLVFTQAMVEDMSLEIANREKELKEMRGKKQVLENDIEAFTNAIEKLTAP